MHNSKHTGVVVQTVLWGGLAQAAAYHTNTAHPFQDGEVEWEHMRVSMQPRRLLNLQNMDAWLSVKDMATDDMSWKLTILAQGLLNSCYSEHL